MSMYTALRHPAHEPDMVPGSGLSICLYGFGGQCHSCQRVGTEVTSCWSMEGGGFSLVEIKPRDNATND